MAKENGLLYLSQNINNADNYIGGAENPLKSKHLKIIKNEK